MTTTRLPLTTLLLAAGLAQAGAAGALEAAPKTMEPEIRFTHSVAGGRLTVRYTVANRAKSPILVFDRLWDMRKNTLDPDWAYVAISGGKAVLKRAMETMPESALVEEPPVPYGREVPAGGKAAGSFTLELPLREKGAYDFIVKRGAPSAVAVKKLEFQLGWCLKPDAKDLPPGVKPVKLAGESLLLLPYGSVEERQKVGRSSPRPVELKGLAARRP